MSEIPMLRQLMQLLTGMLTASSGLFNSDCLSGSHPCRGKQGWELWCSGSEKKKSARRKHFAQGRFSYTLGRMLLHCTMAAFAMFRPPAICDLESQNKSVPFPLITVKGLLESTLAVDMLTTTNPP